MPWQIKPERWIAVRRKRVGPIDDSVTLASSRCSQTVQKHHPEAVLPNTVHPGSGVTVMGFVISSPNNDVEAIQLD
jgi:hypothetical protein